MGINVLGISSLLHDSSAVLLGEGQILAAIEEGKLHRKLDFEGIPQGYRFLP